jgi:hypothetical protein
MGGGWEEYLSERVRRDGRGWAGGAAGMDADDARSGGVVGAMCVGAVWCDVGAEQEWMRDARQLATWSARGSSAECETRGLSHLTHLTQRPCWRSTMAQQMHGRAMHGRERARKTPRDCVCVRFRIVRASVPLSSALFSMPAAVQAVRRRITPSSGSGHHPAADCVVAWLAQCEGGRRT